MRGREAAFFAALLLAGLLAVGLLSRPAGPPPIPSRSRTKPPAPPPRHPGARPAAPCAPAPPRAPARPTASPPAPVAGDPDAPAREALHAYLRHALLRIGPDGRFSDEEVQALARRLAAEPAWRDEAFALLKHIPIEFLPARDLIFRAFAGSEDPVVRGRLREWIREKQRRARAALPRTRTEKEAALAATDPEVLRAALKSLRGADLRDPLLMGRVRTLALDPHTDPWVRGRAFGVIARSPGGVTFLVDAAARVREGEARRALFEALGAHPRGDPRVRRLFLAALADPGEAPRVRCWAVRGLERYPDGEVRRVLLATLQQAADAELRLAAATALRPQRNLPAVRAAARALLQTERNGKVRDALRRLLRP